MPASGANAMQGLPPTFLTPGSNRSLSPWCSCCPGAFLFLDVKQANPPAGAGFNAFKPRCLSSWKDRAPTERPPTCYDERKPATPWLAPDERADEAVEDAEYARDWLANGAPSNSLGGLQRR